MKKIIAKQFYHFPTLLMQFYYIGGEETWNVLLKKKKVTLNYIFLLIRCLWTVRDLVISKISEYFVVSSTTLELLIKLSG